MDGPNLNGHRLARLARQAIAEAVGGPVMIREEVTAAEAAFDVPKGNFVTLTLDGRLRGCIGSLTPHGGLVEEVLHHACSAALNDPRFEPVHPDMLPRLTVEVSLLSPLQLLTHTSEGDLLRQLRPEVDGLLLEYQGRSATFLPQVWENLQDPHAFLSALKQKAGWPALFWSPDIQACTYTAEAWRDEPRPVPPRAAALLGPPGPAFHYPARHWHRLANGRLRCEVCPHGCALGEGQRGRCFQRQRLDHRMVLTSYGRTSGFSVDPIEKKPLHHFLPGSSVLSFGTVGCNLSCRFCQNWNLSQSQDLNRLHERATPEAMAAAARDLGCRSVAFTYNEPAVFLEYVSDVAEACHAQGIATMAVTAGYMNDAAREDFFTHLDAANVDLKAFSEGFYKRVVGGSLQPVLDTLRYLVHKTDVWTEITTLLIPGLNDSDTELHQLCDWMADDLGVEIPLHFSAFHPDHRMRDVPPTPLATLRRARTLALEAGLKHVYIGNIHDPEGATTTCAGCDRAIIRREGFQVLSRDLDAQGRCRHCGAILPGRFGDRMLRSPQSFHAADSHA